MNIQISTETATKMANFTAAAQPVLRAEAARLEKAAKLAPIVVDQLVQRGLVTEDARARKVAAYTNDPMQALIDLQTVAGLVGAASVGGPSGQKEANLNGDGDNADATFERIVMSGSAGR